MASVFRSFTSLPQFSMSTHFCNSEYFQQNVLNYLYFFIWFSSLLHHICSKHLFLKNLRTWKTIFIWLVPNIENVEVYKCEGWKTWRKEINFMLMVPCILIQS